MKRLATLVLLAALAAGAEAQLDLSQYDKVLLPAWTSTQITGANGSKFQTFLEVQPSGRRVTYYPAYSVSIPPAPVFGPIHAESPSLLGLYDFVPVAHGRLMYAERGGAETLTFGYQVVALDAAGVPRYTTLPVVRERDFRTGPLDIVGIPTWPLDVPNTTSPGFRQRNTLRVYDVDNTGTLQVRVTWGTVNQAIPPIREASRIVDVTSRDLDEPSYPYFAEVDLDTLIPPCFGGISATRPCAPTSRVIRITPLTPEARFWAFVSTTDNVTQAVSIHAPQ